MEKYESCWQNLENEDRNCTDKCVPNCTKWYYEFELTFSLSPYLVPLNLVTFKMPGVDYFIMTEEYTYNFELFIAALGGAIGIWLGLDFCVLIEFLFKPTMMLIRKFLSKDGESIFGWFSEKQCCFSSRKKISSSSQL